MHEFVLVAWYAFDKNENKMLHYLVFLKPSDDIVLISIAIKFACKHLFNFFQNFSVFHRVMDRRKCRPITGKYIFCPALSKSKYSIQHYEIHQKNFGIFI